MNHGKILAAPSVRGNTDIRAMNGRKGNLNKILNLLTLATVWIFGGEVPVSVLAPVAPGAVDVGLAVALSSYHLFLII